MNQAKLHCRLGKHRLNRVWEALKDFVRDEVARWTREITKLDITLD